MRTKTRSLLARLAVQAATHERTGDEALRRQAERSWDEAGGAWGYNQKGRMLWRKSDGTLTVHRDAALRSWTE